MPTVEHDFGMNFNFGTDSVFTNKYSNNSNIVPISGAFLLLDGTDFLLLDGTDFNLL